MEQAVSTNYGELTPKQLFGILARQSKAYNVGYALGMTAAEIDQLSDAEYDRLIPLAREVVAGVRSTSQHMRLAQHMTIARWAAQPEETHAE